MYMIWAQIVIFVKNLISVEELQKLLLSELLQFAKKDGNKLFLNKENDDWAWQRSRGIQVEEENKLPNHLGIGLTLISNV